MDRRRGRWLALGGLPNCGTGRGGPERTDQRLRGPDNGDFIGETGLTPSNFYPITGGRVFVIDGPPVVSSYGGYSNVTACRLLIQTEPNERGATADEWTIVGTTRTGPCQLLPI